MDDAEQLKQMRARLAQVQAMSSTREPPPTPQLLEIRALARTRKARC